MGFHKSHLYLFMHHKYIYYDVYLTAQQTMIIALSTRIQMSPSPIARGVGDINNYDNIRLFSDCSMDVDDSLHEYRIPEDNA